MSHVLKAVLKKGGKKDNANFSPPSKSEPRWGTKKASKNVTPQRVQRDITLSKDVVDITSPHARLVRSLSNINARDIAPRAPVGEVTERSQSTSNVTDIAVKIPRVVRRSSLPNIDIETLHAADIKTAVPSKSTPTSFDSTSSSRSNSTFQSLTSGSHKSGSGKV
eukprot:243225_1